MEGADTDELYLDLPADDVRPVSATSGGNSPHQADMGEPDYQASREDVFGSLEGVMENPNIVDENDDSYVQSVGTRRYLEAAMRPGHGTTRTLTAAEPPYEQQSDALATGQEAATGRGTRRTSGTATSDLYNGTSWPGGSQTRVPGGTKSAGRDDPASGLLNGTGEHPSIGRPITSEGSKMRQVGPHLSRGNEGSLEQLVQQLLDQNAALQQELLERRGSSGSVSTGSVDGRLEGRGSLKSTQSEVGSARRGKGIGSELALNPNVREQGHVFTPPWTSFAPSPEAVYGLSGNLRPVFEVGVDQHTVGSSAARAVASRFPSAYSQEHRGYGFAAVSGVGTVQASDPFPTVGPDKTVPPTAMSPSVKTYGPSIVVDPNEGRLPMQVQHWKAPPVSKHAVVGNLKQALVGGGEVEAGSVSTADLSSRAAIVLDPVLEGTPPNMPWVCRSLLQTCRWGVRVQAHATPSLLV